jgi:hypothetical protein
MSFDFLREGAAWWAGARRPYRAFCPQRPSVSAPPMSDPATPRSAIAFLRRSPHHLDHVGRSHARERAARVRRQAEETGSLRNRSPRYCKAFPEGRGPRDRTTSTYLPSRNPWFRCGLGVYAGSLGRTCHARSGDDGGPAGTAQRARTGQRNGIGSTSRLHPAVHRKAGGRGGHCTERRPGRHSTTGAFGWGR